MYLSSFIKEVLALLLPSSSLKLQKVEDQTLQSLCGRGLKAREKKKNKNEKRIKKKTQTV